MVSPACIPCRPACAAVKLDFITALLKRSLECTGTLEFRGVQADLGEVVAWRNMFWALSDSMCSEATPWVNGAWLPDHAALQTYRVMAPMAYAKIKNIIERNVTSGLIYLPSSARDLNNPQIDQYLAKYVRGSNGMDHVERIKILKLMWDAIGSEFGGRHELYEINYSGSGMKFACSVCAGRKLRQYGQNDGDGRPLPVRVRPERLDGAASAQ